MSSKREIRNARAALVLGIVGVVALLWLATWLIILLPNSESIGALLSAKLHFVFMAGILLFFTIKNFQIARSLYQKS